MKCTGRNCPMQYGTVDPAHCLAADECPYVTKPLTNADRIRAMPDEELAREFTRLDMFCCPVTGVTCAYEPKCQDCFKRWLKQEAKT